MESLEWVIHVRSWGNQNSLLSLPARYTNFTIFKMCYQVKNKNKTQLEKHWSLEDEISKEDEIPKEKEHRGLRQNRIKDAFWGGINPSNPQTCWHSRGVGGPNVIDAPPLQTTEEGTGQALRAAWGAGSIVSCLLLLLPSHCP